jgi:hypothetical protein
LMTPTTICHHWMTIGTTTSICTEDHFGGSNDAARSMFAIARRCNVLLSQMTKHPSACESANYRLSWTRKYRLHLMLTRKSSTNYTEPRGAHAASRCVSVGVLRFPQTFAERSNEPWGPMLLFFSIKLTCEVGFLFNFHVMPIDDLGRLQKIYN